MANSAGSKKRARQAVKRNKHNSQIRAKVRTFIKKVTHAIDAGDKKRSHEWFYRYAKKYGSSGQQRLNP